MTSTSPFSPHGCIRSGPTDLCMTTWFMFPNVILLTEHKTSLLQTFPLVSGACNSSGQILSVKTEVKKALDTSSFSMYFVTRSPVPFSVRPSFSLICLLLLMDLHVALSVSPKIQLQMGFSFLNAILAHSESVSISVWFHLSQLSLLVQFHFRSEFSWELLLIHQ